MNDCDWIICERVPNWAPAIRMSLERTGSSWADSLRLREVRRMEDLMAELTQRPTSLAAVEITALRFGDILVCLSTIAREWPNARCVAVLERSFRQDRLPEVTAALYEAGVAAVATSPRQVTGILEVARHHVKSQPSREILPYDTSLASSAWAALPWQDR